jgi:hypothetical protein
VLVVTRFTVAETDGRAFLERARRALAAFASCAGYHGGRIGRATDDPTLWMLSTEWDGAGAYRRALSSYAVKVDAVPVMYEARDEPSAYEVLVAHDPQGGDAAPAPGVRMPRRAGDADTIGLGHASGPDVPTGFEP